MLAMTRSRRLPARFAWPDPADHRESPDARYAHPPVGVGVLDLGSGRGIHGVLVRLVIRGQLAEIIVHEKDGRLSCLSTARSKLRES